MKLALLGDIAPFGRYCLHRHPEVLAQFEGVRSFLRGHDMVIGNLETPFSEGEGAAGWKSAHIHAHPANIDLLRFLGVTHVTLANNHIGDFGAAAYERTKAVLEQAGIGWFGTEDRDIRLEVQGERIAILGYCSLNTNPSPLTALGGGVNLLDLDRVVEAMAQNQRDGFMTVLAIHSGQEHVHMPSSEDVAFARGLAARFDYVYYGHHPHVVQGAEMVENSLIFYSLGNFVFDDVYTPRDPDKPLIQLSEANKTGAVASVEIIDGKVCDWSVTPIYLGTEHVALGIDVFGFDMRPYNAALTMACSEDYDSRRRAIIFEYIESRHAMRDIKWYLRRLNLNSVGVILAARRNARKHSELFTTKLHKLRTA
ncbi:CapA family protein [Azonexus sp.]|uniref:CapA family protein n=1 Tax=Azonexus sp. TaxID=1872668 RepID=UPI0035B3CD25